jgi:hypothetical protein
LTQSAYVPPAESYLRDKGSNELFCNASEDYTDTPYDATVLQDAIDAQSLAAVEGLR